MRKNLLKLFLLPSIILLLVISYFVFWNLLGLPPYKDLAGILQNTLATHGIWVTLLAAFIEGALLVGNYLPGGLVIFLAIISAGNNLTKIFIILGLVVLGMMLANILNYLLGRFGFYHLLVKFGMTKQLDAAKDKWVTKSFKVIFLSYWQANLAALTATAAGILKIEFRKFLTEALIGVVFWNILWTLFAFTLREQAVNAITNIYIIAAIALLWAIYTTIKKHRAERT